MGPQVKRDGSSGNAGMASLIGSSIEAAKDQRKHCGYRSRYNKKQFGMIVGRCLRLGNYRGIEEVPFIAAAGFYLFTQRLRNGKVGRQPLLYKALGGAGEHNAQQGHEYDQRPPEKGIDVLVAFHNTKERSKLSENNIRK